MGEHAVTDIYKSLKKGCITFLVSFMMSVSVSVSFMVNFMINL